MSLPRSYTLPREFKFNRQGRKIIKNEHFVASTNSSDGEIVLSQDKRARYFIVRFFSFLSGDVDSCDDNEFEDDDDKLPISQRMRNRRTNNLNKNRLHSNSPFNNINPNIMAQKQYQNSYNLRAGNIKVNNLDLINGCIDSRYEITNQNAAGSRQSRSRMFGQKTFNRHETKL
jgi:hypothetical protein